MTTILVLRYLNYSVETQTSRLLLPGQVTKALEQVPSILVVALQHLQAVAWKECEN